MNFQKPHLRISLIRNQLSIENKIAKEKDQKYINCALNYFHFDDYLKPDEKLYRLKLRKYLEDEKVAYSFNELIEKQEFPFDLLKNLTKNFPGIFKGFAEGNHSSKISSFKWASNLLEIGRCDSNFASIFAIISELCIKTLFLFGSKSQKNKYLQKLIDLELIASWCLTEPEYGSDASSLATTAEEVENGYILNGNKRWIGNATFADILFVWARNKITKNVQCFIVEKNSKGLSATKIEGKLALRAIHNADLKLDNVFIPKENKLEKANKFSDTNKILLISRLGISWIAIGMALGAYDQTIEYISKRKQFGKSISSFQISQNKISLMLANIQAMLSFSLRMTQLLEKGNLTIGKVSMLKAYNTKLLREIVSLGRELHGGNGILMDYKIMKLFIDTEATYTYEGTYDINMLVASSELTGIKAFK